MTEKKSISVADKDASKVKERDTFETPKYATDLIVSYIPEYVKTIWECASGGNRMVERLEYHGYGVWATDIDFNSDLHDDNTNFVTDDFSDVPLDEIDAIITNPPFSVKSQFVERAFQCNKPFALLLTSDYSKEMISWIQRGCERVVPTSRINYITPRILQRVHEGEIWRNIVYPREKENLGMEPLSLTNFKKHYADAWKAFLIDYADRYRYKSKSDVPSELLYRYSSAQYHTMWLTYGFDIGRPETFVDLPVKVRKENM